MDPAVLFTILVPATYFVFLVTERRWPARAFPSRPGWQWVGVGFLVLSGTIGTLLPLAVPEHWLAAVQLVDGSRLGVVGGAIAGIVALEGLVYAWHRSAHNVRFLWRGFHQLHHSPQRVDIAGSVLFHPLEMAVYALLPLAAAGLLGLDPLAGALVGYFLAFAGYFQHWNVRTPAWLGYLIQRPESHCVHHRRGFHFYNYADLPVWDMLFGTFRNPRQFNGECGFEVPADRRMGAMLAFADVNAPFYGPDSFGIRPVA